MKTTTIKQTPKGEYLRIGSSQTVYIRGDYDRSSKKYELHKFEDVNAFRYVKGTVTCITGFEF